MKLVTQIILNMIGVIVRVFCLGGCINSLENQMARKLKYLFIIQLILTMRAKLADPFLIGINRYLTKKTNLKKNPQSAGFFMLNQENFPNKLF